MGSAADYTRHFFRVQKTVKTYTVYSLTKVENGTSLLPPVVRLEDYRGFSKATDIKHYFRLRTCSNWQKCEKVTGLRPTRRPGVYHGNWKKGITKSLILFQLSPDRQTLIVDVFRAFYPYHFGILEKIIQTHQLGL
jgi:hypothetical protein